METNISKLIRGTDGYWRFPDTTADLRWVDKAITIEEILNTTAAPFLSLAKRDPEMAEKMLDLRIENLRRATIVQDKINGLNNKSALVGA